MGIYLNPRNDVFKTTSNSDLYVDKTEMISYINSIFNTTKRYMCVSRPRRFGKTMAVDMLCAYYGIGDSRELFVDKKLAKHDNWDKYLNRFDVIRVVMTDFIKKGKPIDEAISNMQKLVTMDIIKQYPDIDYYDTDNIIRSMSDIYEETGKQFVIIIDEWDAAFRVCKEDREGQDFYLDFLRDWLKDKGYVALAYMTGILPIKKYGQHSALNMFYEYSIINPMWLAPYTGFTEEEVRELCNKYNMIYDDIERWYDGYNVNAFIPVEMRAKYRKGEYDKKTISIYSPLSVIEAISSGVIQNYWNKTETYEALANYIRLNLDGLKDEVALLMGGGRVKVNIDKYQNDMTSFNGSNDVLVMLIHLGYLGYDIDTEEAYIPNQEILAEFKNSTESEEWVDTLKAFRESEELLEATWNMDEENVAKILEKFHDGAENKTYNSEAALSYAIQMAYYAGQKYYTTIQELDSGKGYADLVYLPSPRYPDKPALLIELKYDKSVSTAADQIQNKKYSQKLEHYKGNILVVSVNYNKEADANDPDYKHHTCRIEKACLDE